MIIANKGDILKVFYFRKRVIKIDRNEKEESKLLDQNAREALYAFVPPSDASPQQISSLLAQRFLEARAETRDGFEKPNIEEMQIDFVYHQVGDPLSQAELNSLPLDVNFVEWFDPEQVQILSQWKSAQ